MNVTKPYKQIAMYGTLPFSGDISKELQYAGWKLYKEYVGKNVFRGKTRQDTFFVCLLLAWADKDIRDIKYSDELKTIADSAPFSMTNTYTSICNGIRALNKCIPEPKIHSKITQKLIDDGKICECGSALCIKQGLCIKYVL